MSARSKTRYRVTVSEERTPPDGEAGSVVITQIFEALAVRRPSIDALLKAIEGKSDA